MLSYNSIEFLATIFAANHLGAIAMPINWRLAAAELRFILEHSQARALVCDDALLELANDATHEMDGDLVRVCTSTKTVRGLGAVRRPRGRARAPGARARRSATTSTG